MTSAFQADSGVIVGGFVCCLAKPRTAGKKADPRETGEPATNYGADLNTLTELIESGTL